MAKQTTLWDQASVYIKPEVGPMVWSKWFNDATILETQQRGSVFYLCVSDSWAKSTMNMFYDVIQQALFKASGEQLELSVVDLSTENIPTPELQQLMPNSTQTVFNPNYTFESFVVGDSNRFAAAAAMAVADSPARSYNPLFIYGGSGLGKTHLMHAIGHAVLKKNPYKKVTYVSSETFTNEFIYMLRDNRLDVFKAKYRSSDILLIDDIQFLANKNQIQEEFFHTFNALHEAGKQIVISSDRHPKEINPLEERLRSRFAWGLITDIQAPDWETRCAILQSKAMSSHMPIADDVVFLIAEKIHANIRELEGALNRLMYYSELNQASSIDMKMAQEALKDIFMNDNAPKLTISMIQRIVAEYYQITVDDLKSKRKDRDVSYPRQIGMYLCRELMGATTTQIGRDFGNRHYTTVMYACETITEQRMRDANLDHSIQELERKILNQ